MVPSSSGSRWRGRLTASAIRRRVHGSTRSARLARRGPGPGAHGACGDPAAVMGAPGAACAGNLRADARAAAVSSSTVGPSRLHFPIRGDAGTGSGGCCRRWRRDPGELWARSASGAARPGYSALFNSAYTALLLGNPTPGVAFDITRPDDPVLRLLGYSRWFDREKRSLGVVEPAPPRAWVARSCGQAPRSRYGSQVFRGNPASLCPTPPPESR